jgi:hypothetical protein
MSSINQLTEASAVSSSMQLPVYDSQNGQPRRVSVNQLQAYLQENLEFGADGAPFELANLTVAEINASYPASAWNGFVVYCSNGDGGSPCLAVSNGTDWKRIALGATIAA